MSEKNNTYNQIALLYWKNRCKLAEKCIEVSPCDPDITDKQIKAHKEWEEFKSNPEISIWDSE